MSKTICSVIEHDNGDRSILTVNEEKKRYHILLIGKDVKKMFSPGQKKMREYKRNGYQLVPSENVFDDGDEFEAYDAKGNLMESGRMDCSDVRPLEQQANTMFIGKAEAYLKFKGTR